MRTHAAPIGLVLLLVAIAASGCGSGAQIARAQAQAISITDTTALTPSDLSGGRVTPAQAKLLLDKAGQTAAGATTTVLSETAPLTETAAPTLPLAATATGIIGATSAPTATSEPTAVEVATATAVPTSAPTATAVPTAVPTSVPTATTRPTATALPTPAPTPAPTAAPAPAAPAALAPPDRLVAPTIGLDTKVLTVGWHEVKNTNGTTDLEWDVATFAAGWHKTSAPPGQVGNTVIAGHSDIEGEVFKNLAQLKVGDPITIFAGGREFDYKVTDTFIVQEKDVPMEQRLQNARWIGPFPDNRLTMLTCWPPNNNTHRAFVIARPVASSGH
jgi:sortase A